MARLFSFLSPLLVSLLLAGCSLNIEGKQSALDPQGPIARNQYGVFLVTLWVTLFLFVTVGGVLAYTMWKFRQRPSDDPNFIPPQSHGHPLVEVGLVMVSAALLVVIAVPTFKGIVLKHHVPEELEANAIQVNVHGYQWWWGFEYPDEGFHTANEIVFPAGRAVKLTLNSQDVIHSFWLPKLAGKTDLIPGQTNTMWIKADEPGYFYGQCAEYCGDSHAYMLFRAVALNEADWQAWRARQKSKTVDATLAPVAPALAADPAVQRGVQVFKDNCNRCHSLDSAVQTMGPNLAHFGSRTAIAAGWLENTPENLHRWIKDPESVKPGSNMWRGFMQKDGRTVQMPGLDHANLSDAQVDDVVAYLHTLK